MCKTAGKGLPTLLAGRRPRQRYCAAHKATSLLLLPTGQCRGCLSRTDPLWYPCGRGARETFSLNWRCSFGTPRSGRPFWSSWCPIHVTPLAFPALPFRRYRGVPSRGRPRPKVLLASPTPTYNSLFLSPLLPFTSPSPASEDL